MSGFEVSWNVVNVSRDDVDRKFTVHVWRVENTRKIVLNHSTSKKMCIYVSNAPLKMPDSNNMLTIYTRNWRFRFNTI